MFSEDTFFDFLSMKLPSKTTAYATMKKKKANEEEINLEKEKQRLEKNNTSQEDSVIINDKSSA